MDLAVHSAVRTQEMGIRIALGAEAGDIVKLVLGQGPDRCAPVSVTLNHPVAAAMFAPARKCVIIGSTFFGAPVYLFTMKAQREHSMTALIASTVDVRVPLADNSFGWLLPGSFG